VGRSGRVPGVLQSRWIGLIRRTVHRTGAEVMLCRDHPLAPAAVWVGRAAGIPVVLDMAENYPAMLGAVREAGRQELERGPAHRAHDHPLD